MRSARSISLVLLLTACSTGSEPSLEDGLGTGAAFIEPGSAAEAAVLALVNDPAITEPILDDDVRLDVRAARGIIARRAGADLSYGTADDQPFTSIDEVDAVSYVGPTALTRLFDYAEANGYYDGGDTLDPADKVRATLAFVNSDDITLELLDVDVALDVRAARNIVTFRAADDAVIGTSDNQYFLTLDDLDGIAYVGESALGKLLEWALDHGYLLPESTASADVIFSPQMYGMSHNVRIAEIIGEASHSLDIAMYSFSDAGISDALEAAVARGVDVRFIFETANDDRKELDPTNTKSGRLEAIGINVRYVNKIMHHKYMIVDGPRDVAERAATATVVTGSGNWSWGAASRYDENTLFLQGYPEITLRLQKEFNLMWEHSRDLVADPTLPFELSTYVIDTIDDDPATHATFTSDNFSVSGDTFRIVTGRDTVVDELVAAIEGATESIHIASGHLRSRKVAEALEAATAANPELDIRILLDGQEYISSWYHDQLVAERDQCVADAGTSASQLRKCYDKGFYYGYPLSQAGIPVRYKYYSYRWHYSYAVQMHNKFMIIDGDELWTGSYNLSDNAEHNTFENMLRFVGTDFTSLVQRYEATFDTMWNLNRADDTLATLIDEIENDAIIPLVFTPMALDWTQITSLKAMIRANCTQINSDPFRTAPEDHRVCERNPG